MPEVGWPLLQRHDSPPGGFAAFFVRAAPCYAFFVAKTSVLTSKTANAGLCADCVHARSVKSDRGSTFLLCELSNRDPSFPKYPRLPVLSCRGYEKRVSSQ